MDCARKTENYQKGENEPEWPRVVCQDNGGGGDETSIAALEPEATAVEAGLGAERRLG